MTRFVFGKMDKSDEVYNSEDMKAKMAFTLAGEIIATREDNMPLLVLLSFEIGNGGLTQNDLAQFLYDNYSEHQLTGLHMSIVDKDAIKTIERHFETEEELEQIRSEAKEMQKGASGGV